MPFLERTDLIKKLEALSDAGALDFALDCVDQVKAYYTDLRPGKTELADAVTALRSMAAGTGSEATAAGKVDLAKLERMATQDAVKTINDEAAVHALAAVGALFDDRSHVPMPERVESCMRKCARACAHDAAIGDEPDDVDYDVEQLWQHDRLTGLVP